MCTLIKSHALQLEDFFRCLLFVRVLRANVFEIKVDNGSSMFVELDF